MGEMGDLGVPREKLGARHAHVLARLVEPVRRLLHLVLQDVEAVGHLAQLVARIRLHRHDVDRRMGRVEIAAAERVASPCEKSRSVPEVRRLAALLTSFAE